MLNDCVGVTKNELDVFLQNIDNYITIGNSSLKHKDKRAHDSISLKVDKYIYETLLGIIISKKPKNGAFAEKSIYQLLLPLKEKKYILSLDIKSYFESITYTLFEEISRNESVNFINEIKLIYFRNGYLRRGLKASPIIAEFVGLKIDAIVKELLHFENLSNTVCYARYYDDMIFSSDNKQDLEKLQLLLKNTINEKLSLEINHKKTKLRVTHGAKILGLSFHNSQITVPKKFKNRLRCVLHTYTSMSEYDCKGISDKKRVLGATIGSLYYIINNTDQTQVERYNILLIEQLNELERLNILFEKKQIEENQ